jgi:hypothetical protein
MLHLMKLAVGIRDIAHLRDVQAARVATDPPLCHRTRNAPRRAVELLEGGSLYWVISGAMVVRQRLLDVTQSTWNDGTPCASLVLGPKLVPVLARPMKPFQGWRYLAAGDAPPDLTSAMQASGEDALPDALRRELRLLGLL